MRESMVMRAMVIGRGEEGWKGMSMAVIKGGILEEEGEENNG